MSTTILETVRDILMEGLIRISEPGATPPQLLGMGGSDCHIALSGHPMTVQGIGSIDSVVSEGSGPKHPTWL